MKAMTGGRMGGRPWRLLIDSIITMLVRDFVGVAAGWCLLRLPLALILPASFSPLLVLHKSAHESKREMPGDHTVDRQFAPSVERGASA